LAPEWIPALKDLDGFSHLILLYHFHQIGQWVLEVTPFLDTQPRGLFATRTPQRPNPIG
jgi:tRNA (adenine37-N6)-methyltransferase